MLKISGKSSEWLKKQRNKDPPAAKPPGVVAREPKAHVAHKSLSRVSIPVVLTTELMQLSAPLDLIQTLRQWQQMLLMFVVQEVLIFNKCTTLKKLVFGILLVTILIVVQCGYIMTVQKSVSQIGTGYL